MDWTAAKIHPYATHVPLLGACVVKSSGAVLELGCGAYSTPILHALCLERELVSYESDPEWFGLFKRFGCGRHRVELVEDWVRVPIERDWAVALVDHAPPAQRAVDLARLRGHARLIVVHDTEHRLYELEPVLARFAHRREWRGYSPWVSVVSEIDDLNWLQWVPQVVVVPTA